MQPSPEDLRSECRGPLVNKIEAVLSVCRRAQGWDEDVSADFIDELMAAWDRKHVPDQPFPREKPSELASDILLELDNLKHRLETSHPEGTETIKQCLKRKLVSLVILCELVRVVH